MYHGAIKKQGKVLFCGMNETLKLYLILLHMYVQCTCNRTRFFKLGCFIEQPLYDLKKRVGGLAINRKEEIHAISKIKT